MEQTRSKRKRAKGVSDNGNNVLTAPRQPMKMKLPPEVIFHHDLRLMVWKPTIVNEKAINRILEFMATQETESHKPFNRFIDASSVEAVDLNFRYIFHVSLFRRLSYAGRPRVKSAIFVLDELFRHYSRLHAILTQGSPLQVRIFQQRLDAAKWLGVSVETLEY